MSNGKVDSYKINPITTLSFVHPPEEHEGRLGWEGGPRWGWCLHDLSRGMNLALRKESREQALIAALEYYQRRLDDAEGQLAYANEVLGGVGDLLRGYNDEY